MAQAGNLCFSPCEKIWGVQLCTNNGFIGAKTAKLLSDVGVDYDFIDRVFSYFREHEVDSSPSCDV